MWVGVGDEGSSVKTGFYLVYGDGWRGEGLLPQATWHLCILHTMSSVLYIL